jgi:hypothetical protein
MAHLRQRNPGTFVFPRAGGAGSASPCRNGEFCGLSVVNDFGILILSIFGISAFQHYSHYYELVLPRVRLLLVGVCRGQKVAALSRSTY